MFLRGFPSKTIEAQEALEAIARRIQKVESLRDLVLTTPAGDLLEALEQEPDGHSTMEDIIHRHGLEKYVEDAMAAGVAGAIVPDLLVEEAGPFYEICRRECFSLIQLVTPTTPRDRALRIAASSTGFLYYVSVTGITGERQALPDEVTENVAWLRSQTDLPICIGFGISQPEHVRLLSPVADGLIVGSAFVRRMATAADRSPADVLKEIGDFASSLLEMLEN